MKEIISGSLNILGGISGLLFYILDELNKKINTDYFFYINILIVLFLLMLNMYRLSKVNDNSFLKSLYVLLVSALLVVIVGYAIMHITTVFPIINIIGGVVMVVYSIRNNHCKKLANKV